MVWWSEWGHNSYVGKYRPVLCILTSFQVLHSPESWSKYFLGGVFKLFFSFLTFFRCFFLISDKKSPKSVKNEQKRLKTAKKYFDQLFGASRNRKLVEMPNLNLFVLLRSCFFLKPFENWGLSVHYSLKARLHPKVMWQGQPFKYGTIQELDTYSPFKYRTHINHSKPGLVRFSDLNCILKLLHIKQWFYLTCVDLIQVVLFYVIIQVFFAIVNAWEVRHLADHSCVHHLGLELIIFPRRFWGVWFAWDWIWWYYPILFAFK